MIPNFLYIVLFDEVIFVLEVVIYVQNNRRKSFSLIENTQKNKL